MPRTRPSSPNPIPILSLLAVLAVAVACSGGGAADGSAAGGDAGVGPATDVVDGGGAADTRAGPADADGPDADGPDARRTDTGHADAARDAATDGDGRGVADAGEVTDGSPPSIELITAPSRFRGCWETCSIQPLYFRVTDPDGVADLAGGEVVVASSGALIAALDAGQKDHEVDLTWRRLHEADPIAFDGAQQDRVLRIVYRDVADNVATAEVELTLYCPDGGPACEGRCTEGECFPMVRSCSGGKNCEFDPYLNDDGGVWHCRPSGNVGLGGLCGPYLRCRTGFACHRRDAVGCEGYAGSDGCCTPRCRPGAGDCPEDMTCRALTMAGPCDERVGFCVFP